MAAVDAAKGNVPSPRRSDAASTTEKYSRKEAVADAALTHGVR